MNIIHVGDIVDFPKSRDLVVSNVRSRGFSIIRGLFDHGIVRQLIPRLYAALDSQPIGGTTSGDRSSVRTNSLKWSVGGFSGSQAGNARLMATIYNPLSAADDYGAHSIFKRLIQVRDMLRADGQSTFDEDLAGSSFNACRFQMYPHGGGFMLAHRDSVAAATSESNGVEMFQLLLFITQRGLDFQRGGAFIFGSNGEVDLEGLAQSGDIVVYDGNSLHGVRDIDPQLPLMEGGARGRVVALITIYN